MINKLEEPNCRKLTPVHLPQRQIVVYQQWLPSKSQLICNIAPPLLMQVLAQLLQTRMAYTPLSGT